MITTTSRLATVTAAPTDQTLVTQASAVFFYLILRERKKAFPLSLRNHSN